MKTGKRAKMGFSVAGGVTLGLLFATLTWGGPGLKTKPGGQDHEAQYEEAISISQELLNTIEQEWGEGHLYAAMACQNLAELYERAARYSDAECLNRRALSILEREQGDDHTDVATVCNNLASLYRTTGRYPEAEALYQRALAILERNYGHDHPDIGTICCNLGFLYEMTARYPEAEALYKRAIGIDERDHGSDYLSVARDLNNLALLLEKTGRYAEAESLYKRVLGILEKANGIEHPDVATACNNLAELYRTTGSYAEAEALYRRAIEIDERAQDSDHPSVARDLNNLALLYDNTGRYSEAAALFGRALAIFEKVYGSEHPDVATACNNLALLCEKRGRYKEGEALYGRAISIDKRVHGSDHPDVARDLNNLALLLEKTGRYAQAEPLFQRALATDYKYFGPDHATVASRLNNLARLYDTLGRYKEARLLYIRALSIAGRAGSPAVLYRVQYGLSTLLSHQNNPEAAIYFGKEAVNTIQGLRQNVSGLGTDTLKAYDATVADAYRDLSRMLIAQGRLPEAQRVLELLKEQEYFEFVRRDARSEDVVSGRAGLTAFERAQDKRLKKAEEPLARILTERKALREKKLRTPEEESRFEELGRQWNEAADGFNQALDKMVAAFGEPRKREAEELKEAIGLQEDLRELGQGAVALYTIVDKEGYTLMLVTPKLRKVFTTAITSEALTQKVQDFRSAINRGHIDPSPLARELYDILLKQAQAELDGVKAQTLMWHLDGVLRYLPMAALHDGNDYLVRRYRNVVYTSASKARLKDRPRSKWQGLGMGVSKPSEVRGKKFDGLYAVPLELSGVIKEDEGGNGIVPGAIYLDDQFTWNRLRDTLEKKGEYPLVHIASHFHFESGDDTRSYLVLGNNTPLSLKEVNNQNNLFGGVDLLTLSACETAVGGGRRADGREVDGLSISSQRQGAKSVIATLWPVVDESTAALMSEFYRLRETQHLSKAEALQKAQTAMLTGAIQGDPFSKERGRPVYVKKEGEPSAAPPRFTPNPSAPYSHPYFWAPFILTGNWL